MPEVTQAAMRSPQKFGRVAKLMSLFGFLDDSPTPQQIGLGGSGFGTPGNVYGNMRTWYRDRMQLGFEIETLYKDWADMAEYDIIASALDLYAEEATMVDSSSPGVLWVESPDAELTEDLNDLVDDLHVADIIFSQAYNIAAFGNNFEKLVYNDKGIQSLFYVPQPQMERHWDLNRNLIGFRWKERPPDPLHTVQCKDIGGALWLPWDFLHMRRLAKRRDTEYGEAIIESARQVYKKLKMIEDAMVVYRLDMYPSRIVFNVDTGEADPYEQMKIVNEWRRFIRRSMMISKGEEKMEMRYDPWALSDMIFFPHKKGSESKVDKLQGDADIPEIHDVKFMMDKLIGTLRIPKTYLGMEGGETNSKNSLVQQDVRFARTISSLRRPLIQGYIQLFKIHLALKGDDPEKEFRVLMPPISALEEEVKAEMLATQVDVIARLAEIGDTFGIEKKEWSAFILKNYMHIPHDVVDRFLASLPETEPGEGAAPGEGAPIFPESRIAKLDAKDRARLNEAVVAELKRNPDLKLRVSNLEEKLEGRIMSSKKVPQLSAMIREGIDKARKTNSLASTADRPSTRQYTYDGNNGGANKETNE